MRRDARAILPFDLVAARESSSSPATLSRFRRPSPRSGILWPLSLELRRPPLPYLANMHGRRVAHRRCSHALATSATRCIVGRNRLSSPLPIAAFVSTTGRGWDDRGETERKKASSTAVVSIGKWGEKKGKLLTLDTKEVASSIRFRCFFAHDALLRLIVRACIVIVVN